MPTKQLTIPGDLQAVSRVPSALLDWRNRGSTVALAGFDPRPLRAPAQPLDQADGGRTKLWQIASPLHCSIIGTCLTTGELRALLRKFKAISVENKSDHDLHSLAVSAVG